MSELLCKIPDYIGWMFVGVMITPSVMMLFKLDKLLVQMWKEWQEEDSED